MKRLTASPAWLPLLSDAAKRARTQAGHRAELFARAEQCECSFRQPGGAAASDASVRVGWLLAECSLGAALVLAQQNRIRCMAGTLETLARKLPKRHNPATAQLLRRVFEEAMAVPSSPYSKPLELVRTILKRLAPQERAGRLAELRVRYKPKRRFIAGLS